MTSPSLGAIYSRDYAAVSAYPASFNNNSALFAASLFALISISVFSLCVICWMARDLWLDRIRTHPKKLLFCYRLSFLCAALAAFMRSTPPVVYMTCFGEEGVSSDFLGRVLMVQRTLEFLSLPVAVSWMGLLILTYPFVVLALRSEAANAVEIDAVAMWPRLVRPVSILFVVSMISLLMAVAKGYRITG